MQNVEPTTCAFWKKTLREALDLFFFAAAFAVLFNLYDSDGIEFRPPQPRQTLLQNQPKTDPVAYAGWKKPDSKTPLPPHENTRISFEGAKIRFEKKHSLFVDARPSKDYVQGHIAGALSFDVNDYEKSAPHALSRLPLDRELVIYCSGGDCDDSLLLGSKLKEIGYKNISLYEGGYPEWKKAGMPLALGETP